MHLIECFSLLLVSLVCAQKTELVRDYFVYKNISHVVGFSCDSIEYLHEATRTLSDYGMTTSWAQIGPKLNFTKLLASPYWSLGVLVDFTCDNESVEAIFREGSYARMYDHLHMWLIVAEDLNSTAKLLNDTTFSVATDFVIAVPENNDYRLYDVYNHCKRCGDTLHVELLAVWQAEIGMQIQMRERKLIRRWDHHGIPLKTGCLVLDKPKNVSLLPYVLAKTYNQPEYDNMARFAYTLITPVAEMLNIDLDIEDISGWPINDTFGPMMRKMYNNTIDIGITPAMISTPRFKFARPILQLRPFRYYMLIKCTGTVFIFRTIPTTVIDMTSLTKPFSISVWYSLLAMITIIILILCVIFTIERSANEPDYTLSLLVIIGAFCQQGIPNFSRKGASHIAMLQILIFGYLAYVYYSAAVVSGRLNIPLHKMNDSLYALANSHYKLSTGYYVYFDLLLRDTCPEIEYFKRRWLKVPANERIYPLEKGIQRIAEGGHAYHVEPTYIYPFLERDFTMEMICQLTEVHLKSPTHMAIFSSWQSPVHEMLRIGLLRTISAGLRYRSVKLWIPRKPFCDTDSRFISSLTIYEVTPTIVLFLCGVVCAIIVCVFENIIFYLIETRKMRLQKGRNRGLQDE